MSKGAAWSAGRHLEHKGGIFCARLAAEQCFRLEGGLLLEAGEKNNHQVLWVIFRASVNTTQITRALTIEANLGKSRQVFSNW